MKVKLAGQVLKVLSGTNKNTGKEYTCAHLYDGDELLRVYNVDLNQVLENTYTEILCSVRVDFEQKAVFISAIR